MRWMEEVSMEYRGCDLRWALSSDTLLRLKWCSSLLGLHTVLDNTPCSPSLPGCLDPLEFPVLSSQRQPYMRSCSSRIGTTHELAEPSCRLKHMARLMDGRGGIIPRRLVGYHIHLMGLSNPLQSQAHKTGVSIYSGAETERILTWHSLGWPTLYLVDPFRSSPNSP
jgi:hypothetical protein